MIYEIDLVLEEVRRGQEDAHAFATVRLPIIPKVGQDIHFEAAKNDAGNSGTYRVTAVGYHVKSRKLSGVTADLFGISLTVTRLDMAE